MLELNSTAYASPTESLNPPKQSLATLVCTLLRSIHPAITREIDTGKSWPLRRVKAHYTYNLVLCCASDLPVSIHTDQVMTGLRARRGNPQPCTIRSRVGLARHTLPRIVSMHVADKPCPKAAATLFLGVRSRLLHNYIVHCPIHHHRRRITGGKHLRLDPSTSVRTVHIAAIRHADWGFSDPWSDRTRCAKAPRTLFRFRVRSSGSRACWSLSIATKATLAGNEWACWSRTRRGQYPWRV